MFTTKQQVFDHVAAFIVKQGKPSGEQQYGGFFCMYNGPDGTACAVGCLFEPEARRTLPKNQTVPHLISIGALKVVSDPDSMESLLRDLQSAHDLAANDRDFMAFFKARMLKIATVYRLTVPEVLRT